MAKTSVTDRTTGEAPTGADPTGGLSGGHTAALAAILAASAVSLSIGVYSSVHDPTGRSLPTGWFTSTESLKTWLATIAIALLATQPLTGFLLRTRTRDGIPTPTQLFDIHRLIGTVAFGLTLPVVFHCLWSLGFQTPTPRVAIHSLTGTAAYGAYAAKILSVRRDDSPRWLVPTSGAVVAVLFVVAWWSSALWYLTSVSAGF